MPSHTENTVERVILKVKSVWAIPGDTYQFILPDIKNGNGDRVGDQTGSQISRRQVVLHIKLNKMIRVV